MHRTFETVAALGEYNEDHSVRILCKQQGAIIGQLDYTKIDQRIHISHLFVKPEVRRKRVASDLMLYVMTTLSVNTAAITFMVEQDEQHHFAQAFMLENGHGQTRQ